MPLEVIDTCSLRSILSDVTGRDEHQSGTKGELEPPCHRFGDEDTTQCKFLLGVDAGHRSSNVRESLEEKDSQQSGESTSLDDECTGIKRKSRTWLTREQKMEVLKLKRAKVHVPEIARRFSCTERTVYYIARNKEALEKEASSPGYRSAAKSLRPAFFPEFEDKVADLVEEARAHGIPVSRARVALFGLTVKNYLLSSSHTTPEAKAKLDGFRASEKWTRNFVRRRGLVGRVLDSDAESAEPHSDAVGTAENRDADFQPVARRVAESGSTGFTARDVDSSAVPASRGETTSSVGEGPAEKGKVDFQAAAEAMAGGSRNADSPAAKQKMMETRSVDGSTPVEKDMDKGGGEVDPALASGSMGEARKIDSWAVAEGSAEARKMTRAGSSLDSTRDSPEETGGFPERSSGRFSRAGTDEKRLMVRNTEVGISKGGSSYERQAQKEEKGDADAGPNGLGSGGARSSGVSSHFDVLVELARAGGNVDAVLLLLRARESMSGSLSSNRG